jgi:hypothetical protein
MRTLLHALALGACLTVAARAVGPPPPQQVSITDAQADFCAGDYRSNLQKIATCLAAGQLKPTPLKRYELLMLRGERLLRLRQPAAAVVFESAANVLKNQGDVRRVAAAQALAVLVKASRATRYRPKPSPGTAPPPPLDIADPAQRKQAMKLLWEDRSANLAPAIEKALHGASLVPIEKLLPCVWELYTLELAATGNAEQTVATARKLDEHARGLIAQELVRVTRRVLRLNALANEPALSHNLGLEILSYRGLNSYERDELQQLADELVKIQHVLECGRRINRLVGGGGEAWDALLAGCAAARDVAQGAYDHRY